MGDPGKTVAKQTAKFHNLELIFKFNSVIFKYSLLVFLSKTMGFCAGLYIYTILSSPHKHTEKSCFFVISQPSLLFLKSIVL